MNIQSLRSNFVEYQSFLELNTTDILALYETDLEDWIGFRNFFSRVHLPFVGKDSVTLIPGLAVYVKEGLPFARDFSLENFENSYFCF